MYITEVKRPMLSGKLFQILQKSYDKVQNSEERYIAPSASLNVGLRTGNRAKKSS